MTGALAEHVTANTGSGARVYAWRVPGSRTVMIRYRTPRGRWYPAEAHPMEWHQKTAAEVLRNAYYLVGPITRAS